MSQKIHIGKNGPAPCHASKRPCRLGQHYESMEEADKAFAAQQSGENNSLKGVSKKTPVKNEESTMSVDGDGNKTWINKNNQFHRVDGPAIEEADGTKMWFQNGMLHRVDGPALELANGDKEWHQKDKLHRVDGPAVELANGTKKWFKNGERHRVDGPAIELNNGVKKYWVDGRELSEKEFNQKYGTPAKKEESTMTVSSYGTKNWKNDEGRLHRVDGPAVEQTDGTKKWYQNGRLHRIDGPAIEKAHGTKEWYQNGMLHRVDGPAIEEANGAKYWYQNGKHHRNDGPAIEWADGSKEYWINGKRLDEKAFNQQYGTH